jgi:hypothetical protein
MAGFEKAGPSTAFGAKGAPSPAQDDNFLGAGELKLSD